MLTTADGEHFIIRLRAAWHFVNMMKVDMNQMILNQNIILKVLYWSQCLCLGQC